MSPRGETPRTRRVADRIQVELAEIFASELEDPRLRTLTVTGAEVTRDLEHARVWVSGNLTPPEEQAALQALEHATPFFRSLIARRIQLRVVPNLKFEIDRSIETGTRIEQLLREIKKTEKE
jgi:ribosome-binding factor A